MLRDGIVADSMQQKESHKTHTGVVCVFLLQDSDVAVPYPPWPSLQALWPSQGKNRLFGKCWEGYGSYWEEL